MNRIGFLLVIVGALLLPVQAGAEEPPKKTDSGVSVLVEVWQTNDAALIKELEALTDKDPGNADRIHKKLAAATGKAERASRFVSQTTFDDLIQHSDKRQVSLSAGGGFGGFIDIGSTVSLTAWKKDDGQIESALEIEVEGASKPKAAPTPRPRGMPMVPPNKYKVQVKGSVKAPSGTMRMFQSSVQGRGTVYVFVKATTL